MKYQPHEYQRYATNRILEQLAIGLFLDLGLGKTVVTLTAIDDLIYNSLEISKVLVIAPLRVAEDTWSRETEKWDHLKHLRIAKVLGPKKKRMVALASDADLYVINRENVSWLVTYFGRSWPFDMVVIDELSSFKSSKAIRFRALRKVRPLINRIVGLTGTPAPNGLLDLWPQVYLLDQGARLGKTITAYRERYFNPDKRNQTTIFSWVPKPEAENAIYRRLSDLCVSMSSADWLELPERIDRVVPVQLPEAVRKRYKQMEQDKLLPLLEADVVADTAAVLITKLLQMANGAVYDEHRNAQEVHSEKLRALEEIIEAANGKPVLVFYAYRHDYDRIKAYLTDKGYPVKRLDCAADIEAWNKGEILVLLAHPSSAGHGLNLQTGGNIIVWYGLTWSLELYQQANARLHRQGQQHSVIVHHLVAEGTVDEDVMKVLSNKAAGQDALLAAVKARIKKLNIG